jgi:hypothetical protein
MLKVKVNQACWVALLQLAHLLARQEQKLIYCNISMAGQGFDLNDPDAHFIPRVLN